MHLNRILSFHSLIIEIILARNKISNFLSDMADYVFSGRLRTAPDESGRNGRDKNIAQTDRTDLTWKRSKYFISS